MPNKDAKNQASREPSPALKAQRKRIDDDRAKHKAAQKDVRSSQSAQPTATQPSTQPAPASQVADVAEDESTATSSSVPNFGGNYGKR